MVHKVGGERHRFCSNETRHYTLSPKRNVKLTVCSVRYRLIAKLRCRRIAAVATAAIRIAVNRETEGRLIFPSRGRDTRDPNSFSQQ